MIQSQTNDNWNHLMSLERKSTKNLGSSIQKSWRIITNKDLTPSRNISPNTFRQKGLILSEFTRNYETLFLEKKQSLLLLQVFTKILSLKECLWHCQIMKKSGESRSSVQNVCADMGMIGKGKTTHSK